MDKLVVQAKLGTKEMVAQKKSDINSSKGNRMGRDEETSTGITQSGSRKKGWMGSEEETIWGGIKKYYYY